MDRSVSKLHTHHSPHEQSETLAENSAMGRLRDIFTGQGPAVPLSILRHYIRLRNRGLVSRPLQIEANLDAL